MTIVQDAPHGFPCLVGGGVKEGMPRECNTSQGLPCRSGEAEKEVTGVEGAFFPNRATSNMKNVTNASFG